MKNRKVSIMMWTKIQIVPAVFLFINYYVVFKKRENDALYYAGAGRRYDLRVEYVYEQLFGAAERVCYKRVCGAAVYFVHQYSNAYE